MASIPSRTQKIHIQCLVAQLILVHGTKPSQRPVTSILYSKIFLINIKSLFFIGDIIHFSSRLIHQCRQLTVIYIISILKYLCNV
jgi:hypothetical protein